VIGIKKGGELKYNIGFNIDKISKEIRSTAIYSANYGAENSSTGPKVQISTLIKFSQWSGKGNSRIPEYEQINLINAFRMSDDKIANILNVELAKTANNAGRLLPVEYNDPF
jgi:hypothetical protein